MDFTNFESLIMCRKTCRPYCVFNNHYGSTSLFGILHCVIMLNLMGKLTPFLHKRCSDFLVHV